MFFRDLFIIVAVGLTVTALVWWVRPKVDRIFNELQDLIKNDRKDWWRSHIVSQWVEDGTWTVNGSGRTLERLRCHLDERLAESLAAVDDEFEVMMDTAVYAFPFQDKNREFRGHVTVKLRRKQSVA